MNAFTATLLAVLFMGCTPKSTNDTGDTAAASSTPAASSGGCVWTSAYCYDFDGPAWDATSAEAGCDDLSASAAASGAPAGTFDPAGCPSGAIASCTGFSGDPSDPGKSFTIYYYTIDASVAAAVEAGCTDEGGTWTNL